MIAEPATVTVTRLDGNGTWVVALEGEHDAFAVPLLEERTDGVWPTCSLALVDLTAATFVDAAVIRWLLRNRAAAVTASMAVVVRPECVASRVLDLAGAHDVLDCYPSRAAARLGSWDGMLAPSPRSSTPATSGSTGDQSPA